MIGSARAIGMSMSDFWACSLWEFSAAVRGWNKSQGGEEPVTPPTDAEFEEMLLASGRANARI